MKSDKYYVRIPIPYTDISVGTILTVVTVYDGTVVYVKDRKGGKDYYLEIKDLSRYCNEVRV